MKTVLRFSIIALILVPALVLLFHGYFAKEGPFHFTRSGNTAADETRLSRPGPDLFIVRRIIDGNTIDLDDGRRVRLLCVEVPERAARGFDPSSFGLKRLVLNRSVGLEVDPTQPDTDDQGNLLRYVIRKSTNVNVEMVQMGYARYSAIGDSGALYIAEFEAAKVRHAPKKRPDFTPPPVDDEHTGTPNWQHVFLPPEEVLPGVFSLALISPVFYQRDTKKYTWDSEREVLERGLVVRDPNDRRVLCYSSPNRLDSLDDEHIRHLSRLPALESVNLGYCTSLADTGISKLENLDNLRVLILWDCKTITDDAMKTVSTFSTLKYLGLSGCEGLTDAGISELVNLVDLQALILSGCGALTDISMFYVGMLKELATLEIRNIDCLTDDGLSELKSLVKLTWLDTSDCTKLTGAFLGHLTALSKLHTLNMNYCTGLIDENMAHLGMLSSLESLSLYKATALTDGGMVHVGKLNRLVILDLEQNENLTDIGVFNLSGLKSLKFLGLTGCKRLTPACLYYISKIKTLQALRLFGIRNIMDKDTRQFRETLPGCVVNRPGRESFRE
ncbi:thermonuclease family protein [Planctomycetota bacterium]|nr:thermonuclease family protein [Planctomycetota bacterium]